MYVQIALGRWGRELTVPFKFMVSTLTPSPIFNFFGEMVFFGPFSFLRLRFLSTLSSFSRSFVRSASSSFPTPEDWASLLIWRMVWVGSFLGLPEDPLGLLIGVSDQLVLPLVKPLLLLLQTAL